jgi:AcrR family transcriptional regulator
MPEEPQRRRIYGALIDLVLERGYERTTVAALTERAGVSRAEFERLFAGLEDCYVKAYWACVADPFERRVLGAFQRPGPWRERLRASAYEAARFIREHQREVRFGSIEMMGAGLIAQAHRERQLQTIVEIIDAGRYELDDPDSVSRAVAEEVLGAVYTTAVRKLGEGEGEEAERMVPELMYVAVRPYLGHEAAREELTIPPPPVPAAGRGS